MPKQAGSHSFTGACWLVAFWFPTVVVVGCLLVPSIATGRSIDVTFAISHTSYIITKYNTDKITAIMASVELTSTLDYAIAGLKVGCSLLLCVGLLSAVVCRLGARWWLLAEEWAAVDR